MDASAKEDCETIADILTANGLTPGMVDDSAPGVPEGTFEVRVPAAEFERAEELVAQNPLPDEVEDVDDSAELNLETIFHADGALAEVESMEIKTLLEASGIAAIVVGNSVLPNMSFEVRVTHDQVQHAREAIEEAQAAGPAAAERAETQYEAEAAEPPRE
jgi:hypothetical protein